MCSFFLFGRSARWGGDARLRGGNATHAMAAVTKAASLSPQPPPPPVAPTLRTPAVRLSDRPVVLEGTAATEKDAYAFFDHATRRVVTVRRDMDVRVQSFDDSADVHVKCVRSKAPAGCGQRRSRRGRV